MQLRPYQQSAVDAVYDYLRQHDDNPLVVLPVGSGKSIVIARIVKDAVERWDGRVLVVTHSAELVAQNADKIVQLCPELRVGVYSAGLRSRDTEMSVICAGIQSIYRRACELGSFDLILIDEAHAIPADGEGMYRQFLADIQVINPNVRCIGMTATPFRTSQGLICGPEKLFSNACFEVGIRQLIADGYLSSLISKSGLAHADTTVLPVRAGEFAADAAERLMDDDELVRAACAEIIELTRDRQACLIFASGVQHAQHIAQVFQEEHQLECGFVCSETPAAERTELLERFRGEAARELFHREPLKYLVNYGILTTGFDCPRLDAIALLRPTMSPGLLIQMVGRGTRLHPGKRDVLVLDYAENILRHGPIDLIRAPDPKSKGNGEAPAKECPECRSVIAAGYTRCPDCGHEFPPPEQPKHDAKASDAGILSGQVTDTEFDVLDICYSVHKKRGADDDAPRTMRVEYRLGLDHWVSEWVCFEHTGYARRKAEQWWLRRSPDPIPGTAEEAVTIAEAGGVALPESITVRSIVGEQFDRIAGYKLGPPPEAVGANAIDLDDVPF